MSRDLGVTYDALIVDVLHCMHLGVLQRYISFVWWPLILRNAFDVDAVNKDELIVLSVGKMRAKLFAFYPAYRAENPEHSTLTELSDLSVKTLGPEGLYLLKTKAAMTRPLVPFTTRLLREIGKKIPNHRPLLRVGESLDRMLRVMREKTTIMRPTAVQDHLVSDLLSALLRLMISGKDMSVFVYIPP